MIMESLQPVYVLHTRNYRETSLLVDLLTKNFGRICVLAKGVKTAKSSMKGLLQPFMPLLASWRGKGELPVLSQLELLSEPLRFQKVALVSALYLNELLMLILHRDDPCESIFDIYKQTLEKLTYPENSQIALRIFEKYLLQELGYALSLTHDIETHKPIYPDRHYRFLPEQGFILSEASLAKGNVFSGKSLIAMAHDDYSDINVLRDAKKIMRMAFAPLLGGKSIRTRELLV